MIDKFNPAIELPSVYQIPRLLLARFQSQVTDWADYFNYVSFETLAEEVASEERPAEWVSLTFRIPDFPRAEETPGFTDYTPVEAVVEIAPSTASNWDKSKIAADRHNLIRANIVGFFPSLDRGQVLLPVQLGTRENAPVYLPLRDSFFTSAVYRITVSP